MEPVTWLYLSWAGHTNTRYIRLLSTTRTFLSLLHAEPGLRMVTYFWWICSVASFLNIDLWVVPLATTVLASENLQMVLEPLQILTCEHLQVYPSQVNFNLWVLASHLKNWPQRPRRVHIADFFFFLQRVTLFQTSAVTTVRPKPTLPHCMSVVCSFHWCRLIAAKSCGCESRVRLKKDPKMKWIFVGDVLE